MRFSAVTALAPPSEVWIFGTEGTIRIESGRQAALGVAARRQGAERDRDSIRATDRLARRGRVRQRDPRPREGLAHDLRGRCAYMEFTEAVWKSAAGGQAIEVGEL